MAVKIRLKRMGANKKPFYRVVVADSRSPRDGRFIEEIGYYNPLKDPAEIKIDREKAEKWLGTRRNLSTRALPQTKSYILGQTVDTAFSLQICFRIIRTCLADLF